jgi:hypothetical protein
MLPFKSAATPLARSSIVKAMTASQAVARFIASLLPTAIKGEQLCFGLALVHYLPYTLCQAHILTVHSWPSMRLQCMTILRPNPL